MISWGQIFFGLRLRLLLLVVVACGPLVALTLHTSSEERRREISSWRQRAQQLTQLAGREDRELVSGTRQLLLAIADSAASPSGPDKSTKKLLDQMFATDPRYSNLGVMSTNGQLLASAIDLPAATNLSNSAFFKRVMESRSFSVGAFPSPFSSRPSVTCGYPVFDDDNKILAVAFAAVDMLHLSRFSSKIPAQVPPGATWTQIDSRGYVMAHHREPDGVIGRPWTNTALALSELEGREAIVEARNDQGVPTIFALGTFSSGLASGKVYTVLAIPRIQLFAKADHTLAVNLMWLALAVGTALVLGWIGSNLLIVRPVKALVRSSVRLTSGDLSARSGLRHGHDELGLLTRSFDRMAHALEHRELELQRTNKKLQALSRRLVEVQESERRQIARELHDEIGQSLTAAEMHIQAALQSPHDGGLERRLRASLQAVEQVLAQVHDLSLNLRPSMLDDLGLEPALRWYTNRQAELAALGVEFHPVPLQQRLDAVIETECFRVAQEALTNVVRHARANTVTVALTCRDMQLHLIIRDDGVGFDVASLRDRAVRGASLGLLSMEERAALAGGGLEFASTPGHGTEVHAWFPLRWRETQETPQEAPPIPAVAEYSL